MHCLRTCVSLASCVLCSLWSRFAEVLEEDPDGSDILDLPGVGEKRGRGGGGGIFEEPAWLKKRQSTLEELEEERRKQEELLVR